jgi:ASC-1-like (ASCH) protein
MTLEELAELIAHKKVSSQEILVLISIEAGMRPSEISKRYNLRISRVSQILKSLQEKNISISDNLTFEKTKLSKKRNFRKNETFEKTKLPENGFETTKLDPDGSFEKVKLLEKKSFEKTKLIEKTFEKTKLPSEESFEKTKLSQDGSFEKTKLDSFKEKMPETGFAMLPEGDFSEETNPNEASNSEYVCNTYSNNNNSRIINNTTVVNSDLVEVDPKRIEEIAEKYEAEDPKLERKVAKFYSIFEEKMGAKYGVGYRVGYRPFAVILAETYNFENIEEALTLLIEKMKKDHKSHWRDFVNPKSLLKRIDDLLAEIKKSKEVKNYGF